MPLISQEYLNKQYKRDMDSFADIVNMKVNDSMLFVSVNRFKDLDEFLNYGKYVDVVRSKQELKKRIVYDQSYQKVLLEFNPKFHDIDTVKDCIQLNSKNGLFCVIGEYIENVDNFIKAKFEKASNWTFETPFGKVLVSNACRCFRK